MCRKLSRARQLPLFPIDQIQRKPGWTPASYDEIKRQHDYILSEDRWIIDGWGPFDLIEARFAASDTIIVVDLIGNCFTKLARSPLWWRPCSSGATSARSFHCLWRPLLNR